MTTKLTDHQLKMCALAPGYEIRRHEATDDLAYFKGNELVAFVGHWNPLSPEDSQNLQADARISIYWDKEGNSLWAGAFYNYEAIATDVLDVSDHPSAPEAMRMAIALAAVAKGEAMSGEKDNG